MRMYNPRLARFNTVDPLRSKFPMITPYQFASNDPVESIDLDGAERLDYRLVPGNDGSNHLQLLSVTESEKELFGLIVHKLPLFVRVEYNGEHYVFAPKQKIDKVFNYVFATPIGDYQGLSKLIKNPSTFEGGSQQDGEKAYQQEVVQREIIANVSELTQIGTNKISRYLFQKAQYRVTQRLAGIKSRELPDLEVKLYGSRVKGNYRPNSDLDVLIVTDNPKPSSQILNLVKYLTALKQILRKAGVKMDVNIMNKDTYRRAKGGDFRKSVEKHSVKIGNATYTE